MTEVQFFDKLYASLLFDAIDDEDAYRDTVHFIDKNFNLIENSSLSFLEVYNIEFDTFDNSLKIEFDAIRNNTTKRINMKISENGVDMSESARAKNSNFHLITT